MKWTKSLLIWVITQQLVVILYFFSRTTKLSHFQDDTNWLFCHLKMLLSMTKFNINFSSLLRTGKTLKQTHNSNGCWVFGRVPECTKCHL